MSPRLLCTCWETGVWCAVRPSGGFVCGGLIGAVCVLENSSLRWLSLSQTEPVEENRTRRCVWACAPVEDGAHRGGACQVTACRGGVAVTVRRGTAHVATARAVHCARGTRTRCNCTRGTRLDCACPVRRAAGADGVGARCAGAAMSTHGAWRRRGGTAVMFSKNLQENGGISFTWPPEYSKI